MPNIIREAQNSIVKMREHHHKIWVKYDEKLIWILVYGVIHGEYHSDVG